MATEVSNSSVVQPDGGAKPEPNGSSQDNLLLAAASGLALMFLKRRLREGKSVEIPSLNIIIPGDKNGENGNDHQ